MKSSRFLFISLLWKDHSENIKQFIALSTSQKSVLEHARNYIHNLDLKKNIGELDDVIELSFLLPKVDYPLNTQAPIILQGHVKKFSNDLSTAHIKSISSFIQLFPECLSFFIDNIFSVPEFLGEFEKELKTMDLEEIIYFANAISKNDGMLLCTEKIEPLIKIVSNAILVKMDGLEGFVALKQVQRCEFPIWKYIKGLPQKVDTLFQSINEEEKLHLFFSLDRFKKNHREWAVVLQQLLCRSLKHWQHTNIVKVFETLISFHVPIREKMWSKILECAESKSMSVDCVDVLCENLSIVSNLEDPASAKYKKKVIETLVQWIECKVKENKIISKEKIHFLLCYAYISTDSAQKEFCKYEVEKILVTQDTAPLLAKLMDAIGVFPKEVVSVMCSKSQQNSQEENIYLLNAVFRSGLPIHEKHIQDAVGSFAHRLFSSRGKGKSKVLSQKLSLMLLSVLCHLDTTKYSERFFPVSTILSSFPVSIGDTVSLLSTSIQCNKSTAISKVFLNDALQKAKLCDDAQLQTIFLALAALRVREAVTFTKLIRIAESRLPSVGLVLAVAKAARSLRLTQQLSRTTLVESITDLDGINFDTFIELLKYCTKSQREHLLKLPGGKRILEDVDLKTVSTSNLLVLGNTSTIERNHFVALLKQRQPMGKGDVTCEEVILNLEEAESDIETELILRIGGSCLEDIDEPQLMRIYRCLEGLSQCPNIAFRILGRAIMRSVKSLSPEEALLWLNLYVKYEIRDDSVAKVLLKKVQSRKSWTSSDLQDQLNRAEFFFGVQQSKGKSRATHNTSYFSTVL